jgi:hypothetical protein
MITITPIEHDGNSRFIWDIRRIDESFIKLLYKDNDFTVIELKDDTKIYVEESMKTLDARIDALVSGDEQ